MILLSVGLPGPLTRWCDAVMASLLGGLGGDVAVGTWPELSEMFGYEVAGSILDGVGLFLFRSDARHFVIGARQPDQALRRIVIDLQARFVLALDDPVRAAAGLLGETGGNPKPAVRAVANSCPFVMQFNGLPGTLRIDADLVRNDPEAAISAIAAHFGIATRHQAASAILGAVGLPGDDAWRRGAQAPAKRLSASAWKMIEGALSGYRTAFRTGSVGQIVWTRDLFYLAPNAGRSLTQPIDVSGDARILIFGP